MSLRDRGEPQPDDVVITRPGPWGNDYPLRRYGWRALDLYRTDLLAVLSPGMGGEVGALFRREFVALAGKRLLCACSQHDPACHGWVMAEELERLTGIPIEPAPGRERP